jgi:plastocyanin
MNLFKAIIIGVAFGTFTLSGPVLAQDAATPMTITLTSYAYAPNPITLKANTSYRLHLVNNATKDHNFSAPEFFAASTIAPADKSKVVDGAVELGDGQTVDVTVTPNRVGTYNLNCTHFMHTMLGMTGKIVVQ